MTPFPAPPEKLVTPPVDDEPDWLAGLQSLFPHSHVSQQGQAWWWNDPVSCNDIVATRAGATTYSPLTLVTVKSGRDKSRAVSYTCPGPVTATQMWVLCVFADMLPERSHA